MRNERCLRSRTRDEAKVCRDPTAPFSTLYLFGRGQDVGFQKAINNSPRKRHHVRFWGMSAARAQQTLGTASFWLNTDRPSDDERVLWVGAGTKDTGFSLTQLTFQVTHATDADTNAERDYIVAELTRNQVIGDVTSYRSGDEVATDRVNRYIADGDIAVASLAADHKETRPHSALPSGSSGSDAECQHNEG